MTSTIVDLCSVSRFITAEKDMVVDKLFTVINAWDTIVNEMVIDGLLTAKGLGTVLLCHDLVRKSVHYYQIFH